MPRYRNTNSGQVVELAKPSHRLERLANWEQLDDVDQEADFEPADDSAVQPSSTEPPLTREYVVESLQGATNAELRVVAEERGLDSRGKHAELVERIAAAIMVEVETDAEESS